MDIKIIYNKNHKLHCPKWEIFQGKKFLHSEKPERIESILKELVDNGFRKLISPETISFEPICKIHQINYVNFLINTCKSLGKSKTLYPSYFISDTYTPLQYSTVLVAKKSVECALTGAKLLVNGEKVVYSLCRPPGHHAEKNKMGGYCYFNNAAVASNYLLTHGRVAIFDIDFHHGNGTQNIFYDKKDVLCVSIHADPKEKFPYFSGFSNEIGTGEGRGYNRNFPLPLGTGEKIYMKTLCKALEIINNYNPKYFVISLGFDTYVNDPIGGFKLTIPFYKNIAQEIKSLNKPLLVIQEGGYNIKDLGKLAISFLKGLEI